MSVVGAGNALHVCSEHLFDTGNVTSIESAIHVSVSFSFVTAPDGTDVNCEARQKTADFQ